MAEGSIVIKVSTAERLIPVENATVFIIKKNSGAADTILASRNTGRSGTAQSVTVETPDREESRTPQKSQPFSTVDIRVEHPMYYSFYIEDAQIFADTQSVQNVSLIPLAIPTEKRTETVFITPQNL